MSNLAVYCDVENEISEQTFLIKKFGIGYRPGKHILKVIGKLCQIWQSVVVSKMKSQSKR